MAETIVTNLIDLFSGSVPKELLLIFLSMLPLVELRGGLIAAALLKIPMWRAVVICIAANMIPVPFILHLITSIFNWLKKTDLFRPMVEKLEKKSLNKSDKIQKYQFWGLLIFVGIPLPGTGAWTGSLIASLLDMKPRKCYLPIFLGLCMATTIMCVITYFIPWLISVL